MSAPIVYEGQVQGQGGTLFKDMKFWIAQRVPMRSTWIQDIENNGGSITKLDKQADYLIADHAKKDAPNGSYSWRWIEDSVKKGKLMDKQDYSIVAPGHDSRPSGSLQHKSTRNAFTKQDDDLLAKFVTKHERQGTAVSGNVIYKQFEEKYPHHTFQSWRDRWVKKLQHMPRPQVSDSDPSKSPEDESNTAALRPPSIPQPSPQRSPASHTGPSKSALPPKRRARFSHLEDQVLLQYVEEMKAHGKGASGKSIYVDFAEDFPQHTWQAWRDRYLRQLRPRETLEESESTPQPNAHLKASQRPDTTERSPNLGWHQDEGPHKYGQSADVRHIDVKPGSLSEDADGVRFAQYNSEAGERRRSSSAMSASAGTQVSSRQANHAVPGSSMTHEDTPTSKLLTPQSQPPFIRTRDDFWLIYGDFLTTEDGFDPDSIETHITLGGQTFELWDLWAAVQAQKVEPGERDWHQITETLGYNWVEHPPLPGRIREVYDVYLSEFEEMMVEYANGERDEEELVEKPQDGENLRVSQKHLPELRTVDEMPSDGQFNSSPPKQPSLKRMHAATLSSDLLYPDSPRKRSRVDRNGEIPSTPDTKNGTLHLRSAMGAVVSSSDKHHVALARPSPAGRRQQEINALDPILEPSEAQHQFREGQTDAETENHLVEPKTQGLQFETQVMQDFDDDSQPEVTPSQQLHSEIDAEERRQQMNQPSPTPRTKVKSPFIADDEDEGEVPVSTLKSRLGGNSNPLPNQPHLPKPKRRSLPATFTQVMKTPGTQPNKSMSHSQDTRSLSSPHHSNQPSGIVRQPTRLQSKVAELNAIVEHWESLGYPHARRCLEATTWEPGLAGRVMQLLSEGKPMPMNWEGVWSTRDDESLRLIYSAEAQRDEREARIRRKAEDRLRNKHGEERLELRRKWLAAKAELLFHHVDES